MPRLPAKRRLLWGKEAMHFAKGNVVKAERKQKLSNSVLTSKYVNYIPVQAPFLLGQISYHKKFIIVI